MVRLNDTHRQSRLLDTVPLHELDGGEHPMLTDPEAQARTAQLLASLKEALAELPLECRQVFLWHRIEGHTQVIEEGDAGELARALGVRLVVQAGHPVQAGSGKHRDPDQGCVPRQRK